jgi:hypothetical protein
MLQKAHPWNGRIRQEQQLTHDLNTSHVYPGPRGRLDHGGLVQAGGEADLVQQPLGDVQPGMQFGAAGAGPVTDDAGRCQLIASATFADLKT